MSVTLKGGLRKMRAQLALPIQYELVVGDQGACLNNYIGQSISIDYLHEIHCVQCGRKTNKSFQQGHCFPCMRKINECNNCIIHPERCLVEQGGCSPDNWWHSQCYGGHVVYLSNTSGLKIGITRESQVPTRWIDQGAMQAIPLFSTQNRYQAGIVEVAFKSFIADKTNWRTMLKQDSVFVDMIEEKESLLARARSSVDGVLDKYADQITLLEDVAVTELSYPVDLYPEKVSSLSLDKTDNVSGVLQGIKGQYLILDTGVINIRIFSGYLVSCQLGG